MSVADFIKILEVKRYSTNTIKTYSSFVSLVKAHFKKTLDELFNTWICSNRSNDRDNRITMLVHKKAFIKLLNGAEHIKQEQRVKH